MKKEKRDEVLNIRIPKRVKDEITAEAEDKKITLSDVCNEKLDNGNRD